MHRFFLIGITTCFFSLSMTAQTPRYQSNQLEVVADLGEYQAIGVSVSSDNRVFVAFPRRGGSYEYGLTEIVNGKKVPYPDKEWNGNISGDHSFFSVQDLYVDTDDNLWVLDSKPAPTSSIFKDKGSVQEGQFKLLKINLKKNSVEKVYAFSDLDKTRSALNDVRVDTEKQLAYFSDPGMAAIVVLDLKTEKTRVVLAGSEVTSATPGVIISYEGKEMKNSEGIPFTSHINSIALTRDNQYFYFKPINHYNLFRIATKDLADASLTDRELLNKVEDIGTTVITHGMEADTKGNIYLTSSVDYSIKVVRPDGILYTLVQDKRILWPDSFGVGTDGYIYFSCAQLQNEAVWNNGVNKTQYPYRIYRVKMQP